jgi:hypothetical protein
MEGGETSFRQTTLQAARRAPRETQPSRQTQLERFSCRSTGDGVRAHGILGILAVRVRPAREEDAWGRAQRLAE